MTEPTPEQLSNPSWVTEQIIHLAAELEHDSELLAIAELEEDKEALDFIDKSSEAGIKVSIAESEKRALVGTDNKYHEMKYKREAKVEMINALKTRMKHLEWEFNSKVGV